jgi:hypothetical protein
MLRRLPIRLLSIADGLFGGINFDFDDILNNFDDVNNDDDDDNNDNDNDNDFDFDFFVVKRRSNLLKILLRRIHRFVDLSLLLKSI